MTAASTVSALWLYPVQSLRGQKMDALDFAADSLRFDRWYGIENAESGEMASASSKRDWRPLITWDAAYLSPLDPVGEVPKVEIRFPDGAHVVSDDPKVDQVLSERLARPVTLRGRAGVRAPARYRLAACHIITNATLRRLSALYPSGVFAPERFRPNVLLDCGETVGFIEQAWLGRRMAAASGLVLQASEDCKRCGLTTRAQGDLPSDPGILHTVMLENKTNAGIYAEVAKAGRMSMGDAMVVG
ncbi:MAG TPA: MOSC domain-containing protein [Dongiaceae bacterium]|jgi:hypothetical protein